MSHPPSTQPPRRTRRALLLCLLLMLAGVSLVVLHKRLTHKDVVLIDTAAPTPVATPMTAPSIPENPDEVAALKRLWEESIYNDGRKIDRSTMVVGSGMNYGQRIELALDEVAVGDSSGLSMHRVNPVQDRGAMEKYVAEQRLAQQKQVYPVFYLKDVPHVAGARRVMTGEITTALRPGVTVQEIEREYGLRDTGKPSLVGLTRFMAKSAFAALDLVTALRKDPRLDVVDHELIKMVQPKSIVPNDTYFGQQWHLQPPELWNINLFPLLKPPVWGDFSLPFDGIRGRNIRIGVVDDGIDINHPDLKINVPLASTEHHAYDLDFPTATPQDPNPAPQIDTSNGLSAEHQRTSNFAHGTTLAGLIAADTNNNVGMAGVAAEAKVIGIRVLSDVFNKNNGSVSTVPLALKDPLPGDYVSPTVDIMMAAAYAYLQNDGTAYTYTTNRLVYEGTADEKRLASFGDFGAGNLIHIKNFSWGAPDVAIFDGAGPEVMGYTVNGVFREGARTKAVKEGRFGLGSILVASAGNGRRNAVEDSNMDSFVNGRETITVGSLARILSADQNDTQADPRAAYSEPGANLSVVAPGAGFYFGAKTQRTLNGAPQAGTTSIVPSNPYLNSLDWSANYQANAQHVPPWVACFGFNQGGSNAGSNYADGAYHNRYEGTSGSAAIVSGVAALMLEANPRMSWIDVQNMLIRTARSHMIRTYFPDGTFQDQLNPATGVDPADPQDVVTIDRDWRLNGGDIWFNHKYGAGLVDAREAVDAALIGILLPAQADFVTVTGTYTQRVEIKEGESKEFEIVPVGMPTNFVVTHAGLKFDLIETSFVGDLGITLTSPSGITSTLVEPHFDGSDNLTDWTFNSVRHWGELATGNWKVRVTDHLPLNNPSIVNPLRTPENPGPARTVTLSLFGYINPEIPVVLKPESDDPAPAEITKVKAYRGKQFRYIMSGNNSPTAWILTNPDNPLDPTRGIPPGLSLAPLIISPSPYLPTRELSGIPTTNGTFRMQVVAANVRGRSVAHYLQIDVVDPPDSYTDWAVEFFGEDADTDPNAVGTADPDNDGYNNIVEFSLGLDPTKPDGALPVAFAKNGSGQWTFTFRRGVTRDMTYDVEISSDLVTWTSIVKSVDNAAPVSSDPNYTVSETASASVPGAGPDPFFRTVTVTNNPAAPAPLYYRLKFLHPRDPLVPVIP